MESFDKVAEALTTYVSRAAEKMRRQGLATAAVVVMLTTNKYKPAPARYYATWQVRLTIATAHTSRLIRAALWVLWGIYRTSHRYKKTGVLFLELAPAGTV